MEENINQLLITLRDSAVGQWWTEHGLLVALLAPLAYVIICCIVSNSSEKRVYFCSVKLKPNRLDVSAHGAFL